MCDGKSKKKNFFHSKKFQYHSSFPISFLSFFFQISKMRKEIEENEKQQKVQILFRLMRNVCVWVSVYGLCAVGLVVRRQYLHKNKNKIVVSPSFNICKIGQTFILSIKFCKFCFFFIPYFPLLLHQIFATFSFRSFGLIHNNVFRSFIATFAHISAICSHFLYSMFCDIVCRCVCMLLANMGCATSECFHSYLIRGCNCFHVRRQSNIFDYNLSLVLLLLVIILRFKKIYIVVVLGSSSIDNVTLESIRTQVSSYHLSPNEKYYIFFLSIFLN